jgi:hypothetical protein
MSRRTTKKCTLCDIDNQYFNYVCASKETHVHRIFENTRCPFITLFISIPMFDGTDSIMQNIPHIQSKCEEYSA